MIFDKSIDSDLWNGERSICLFIHDGGVYWVIDYKEHFCIDAEPELKANLENGRINEEQFSCYCRDFRYGFLQLTADNFLDYIKVKSVAITSKQELAAYFNTGLTLAEKKALYNKVENHLIFGTTLSSDDFRLVNQIVSKLPIFYMNFDRKIYMHMDWDRSHEVLAPNNWKAKSADFSWFIPADEVYWDSDGLNLWKFNYI
ncbi:hypothetical protein [Agarivorans albus]|uniref:Uncharacterized protein n=1 Tax=Agarivorans albus MKT 106 TaxID=1331007 RepID=R9PS78_AGAAL|nr:hypothetical protein [Agarivorans albus]GAD04138.1 hypothetical protein AALB_4218 [Agarivorans albus MKT 106]